MEASSSDTQEFSSTEFSSPELYNFYITAAISSVCACMLPFLVSILWQNM